MNNDAVINSIQDAIIDIFCEFEIVNNDDRQDLIGYTKEGYIDQELTWLNALNNMNHETIHELIDYHCDFISVMDHWQQMALDILDENELSENEFNKLYMNGFNSHFATAMTNVIKMIS